MELKIRTAEYLQNAVAFDNQEKWVSVESLNAFIEKYEGSLGDLPKELSELKAMILKNVGSEK